MARKEMIVSFTTIVTLLILVFTEGANKVLAGFHFKELNIMVSTILLGAILLILTQTTLPKKYYQVGRLSAILCLALSVEAFANWALQQFGQWLTLTVISVIIYGLAWYGYVETHKLKAL